MNWFTNKLFGVKKSRNEELAENMYSALVLGGGPSSGSPSRIDATELEIPIGKLERFAHKRLISLEAMLFVASQIETVERSQKLQRVFGDGQLHPFAMEMGRLIAAKWNQRGIEMEKFDVGERCFDEIEDFLDKPFIWARAWLDEFYDDSEKSGEHYIMWTEQWLKEFEVMRNMVKEYA
ncbi:hypothetical protein KBY25_12990 [Ruegeria pomeroyi]|nr:hypothetical protein [Ruegeria pomeroyi]